jgi:transcriptional regulator with PAS, ATPase and Fis domain
MISGVSPRHEATCITLNDRSLVYKSKAMSEVIRAVRRCAENRLPVLIRGETGTGKELIAELIHARSPTAGSFVPVNCAAIPATLWESVVFGHQRGAFTDAKDQPGLVAQAGSGTLLFDEIGEMPLDVQPKILRLIQERSYSQIGSSKQVPVKCRLLFSTHRNLEAMISRNQFRADLYYRINVLTIELPPLRERTTDIPELANYFIEKYNRELARDVEILDSAVLMALSRYPWPGNVRELENCILRILTNVETDKIRLEDACSQLADVTERRLDCIAPTLVHRIDLQQKLKEYSRSLIQQALRRHSGNQTKAAQTLGISRGKLKYQIKQLGIDGSSTRA